MKLRDYNIVFSGLKIGMHHFNYTLKQEFFDLFEYSDLENPNFEAVVDFNKKDNIFELDFKLNGAFTAYCDLTNEPFEMKIDNTLHLIVKFSDSFNNEDDEILTLSYDAYELNIAQYLYETTVLAIPIKKVHPDFESGKIGADMLKYIKTEGQIEENKEETDPRWDKLKDLLNN